MSIRILGLVVLGLVAGCSSEWGRQRGSEASQGATGAQATASVPAIARAGRESTRSFAALPDRGNLLDYDQARQARRDGPTTWFPVALSEEHALRSIADGEMLVTAPDGHPIKLRYQRHIEHADGNWTWIGRDAEGRDAVLTFGAQAVFGDIPDRGGSALRLTTSAGRSWLAAGTAPSPDASKLDYLVPPALTRALSSSKHVTSALGAEQAVVDGTATVDILLGYTRGFANGLGGQSQAVTRLNNMVDITNLAYANSLLNHRVRLVHALQVEYPDATSNGEMLEKLTGFDDETDTQAPVDPAFTALRAAREQYGADLVSVVRKFQTPENSGCGIAWLLGANETPISTDHAPFGYSVVSDGTDFDETDSKTYVCRQETLAHELGHSMGQVHNAEDSSATGTHAYSYGYREANGSGFYTVMAYPLKGGSQFGIRHFANPDVNFQGRATGVAGTSDNARSLRDAMPAVAAFRATAARAVNDLNADGKSDMVWRHPDSSYFETWLMDGQRLVRALGFTMPAGYRVLTSGDYNGDRLLDLIVTSEANALHMWVGNGTTFAAQPMGRVVGPGWRAYGSSDVDGDGRTDLVWVHPATSYYETWIMNGPVLQRALGHSLPAGDRIMSTGDFNGDGKGDLLVTSEAHYLSAWLGDGVRYTGQALSLGTPYAPGWVASGEVDMNGDRRSDLLWNTPATSYFEWWVMNGATVVRASGATPAADLRVVGNGDFNGDGLLDVLMEGAANDLHVWISDGAVFSKVALNINAGPGWAPLVPGKL